jgi:hypothetical protein
LVKNPEPNNHLEDLGVIKINLTGIGWKDLNWINLAQKKRQVAGFCVHDNEPSGSIRLSGNILLHGDSYSYIYG